jgi:2-polyprenyl-3-methyl-5-hydroxy-6-metoxy-1,4-benzoquinol methylase
MWSVASTPEPEHRVREYWGDAITLQGSIEDAGEGYDLITAFHVAEHLPDPIAMLRKLATRLSNRGRLVIEVPSSEDALLTVYESDWRPSALVVSRYSSPQRRLSGFVGGSG